MTEPHTCPRCEADYAPGVTLCADCGVPLVASVAPPERLTSGEGLHFVTTAGSLATLRAFIAALDAAGIPHFVDREQTEVDGPEGPVTVDRFHFYVREADFRRTDTLLVVAEEDLDASPFEVVARAEARDWEDPFPEVIPEQEFGEEDFAVPDLAPPLELEQRASRLRWGGFVAAILAFVVMTQILDGRLQLAWWLVVGVGVFEAYRRINRADALVSDWRREQGSA